MLRDPLSDILSLINARAVLSASLRASGNWSIRFPSVDVKFNAILEGGCFLLRHPGAEPTRLEAGDCLLLANCDSYVLCSDPGLTPVEAHTVFSNGSATLGSVTGGVLAIGGRIDLDMTDASLLLEGLPRIFHVGRASSEASAIGWLLKRLRGEWSSGLPGGALASSHLAQLLFVEAVRAWLGSPEAPTQGWLHALSDRRIGEAMRVLHQHPARKWRLETLAGVAGMSRSNFALRFKQLVGLAPLDYLLQWRIRLGARMLRTGVEPIGAISSSLGYESESAFSNAFKRVVGTSPLRYRRSVSSNLPRSGRDLTEAR